MITAAAQHLRVLPSEFTVEQLPAGQLPPDASWYVLHRAPEGLTVVREIPPAPAAEPDAPGAPQRWAGLYGETSHGLDLPGMLAAVLGPLAAAGVPVFVSSSYLSDLVLVPRERRAEACSVLREAGHTVTG
ncbi:ACT domain-containing protein [Streptomyces sp. P01-B04]|uniref:ACT domain-containing protein n=1 Tax=Streptomyces poriferorum TaxID=2798799 RepID=A0ABY9J420_9ACTN|nr:MULTISPECIES: ACT domain-containing protein [Streptomyces]MBW5251535.1 ACT domain-containing protein [Streptomyces poriferorum]MBW5258050.1 ACT domain-containing protein [Streptomyces poriferorum]MDP5309916.1 ACT domain-containing protein [Streptomyces sp. Alt4]WLQ60912.1 ACT domain-containing protein [Streptomyces sp. Alt2]WSI61217.1 ACT domain-containing protein [Streptomyces sp. NBC_01336]